MHCRRSSLFRPRLWLACTLTIAVLAIACRAPAHTVSQPPAAPATATDTTSDDALDVPIIVVAAGVRDRVDETVVREAFRRAVEQGERDFGLRPTRRITIYIDPDDATGLEDALGLSQKYAIHLRASRARSLPALLPLMMHEYTHALQYQVGRLRPQWWVEGQADHEAQRVRDPAAAERERRTLFAQLASDVRTGQAPNLSNLRGSLAWDEYVKKAGAGKAYGWGHAAVAFIEARAGFDAVRRIMTDTEGPNTLSRFDELIRETTGLAPHEFDAAVKQWVLEQARG